MFFSQSRKLNFCHLAVDDVSPGTDGNGLRSLRPSDAFSCGSSGMETSPSCKRHEMPVAISISRSGTLICLDGENSRSVVAPSPMESVTFPVLSGFFRAVSCLLFLYGIALPPPPRVNRPLLISGHLLPRSILRAICPQDKCICPFLPLVEAPVAAPQSG